MMTSEVATMSAELAGIAAAVYPDEHAKFYVLDASDVAEYLTRDESADAWYTPWNLNLDEMLKTRGEWQGPHPFIVMDYAKMRAAAEKHNWDIQSYVWCIFVHEMGHHSPTWRPVEYAEVLGRPSARLLELSREKFVDLIANRRELRPWDGDHGETFIRKTLHLAERARLAGWEFGWATHLCAGYRYGLSHVMDYFDTLKSEIHQLAGQTFETIESIAPPRGFTELFAADVKRWEAKNGVE